MWPVTVRSIDHFTNAHSGPQWNMAILRECTAVVNFTCHTVNWDSWHLNTHRWVLEEQRDGVACYHLLSIAHHQTVMMISQISSSFLFHSLFWVFSLCLRGFPLGCPTSSHRRHNVFLWAGEVHGCTKLTISVNVSVNGWESLYVGPVMDGFSSSFLSFLPSFSLMRSVYVPRLVSFKHVTISPKGAITIPAALPWVPHSPTSIPPPLHPRSHPTVWHFSQTFTGRPFETFLHRATYSDCVLLFRQHMRIIWELNSPTATIFSKGAISHLSTSASLAPSSSSSSSLFLYSTTHSLHLLDHRLLRDGRSHRSCY